MPHTQARNAYYARYKVQQAFRDQDYYLQIDSHMQFCKEWDTVLIDQLSKCNHEKPILSVYPADFECKGESVLQMCFKEFNSQGVPLFRAR